VTRKRSTANAPAETPITGVATGNLGTAANLDDTQVLRTEDLQAAAAATWLDDEGPPVAPASGVIPPAELELLRTAPNRTAAPPTPVEPAPAPARPEAPRAPVVATGTQTSAVAASRPSAQRRNVPALAGVAALIVLLLIAGSGFLSRLDLGVGAGPAGPAGPDASANALIEAAPSPSAEPKIDPGKGGGRGKCHGHGHGKNCQGED